MNKLPVFIDLEKIKAFCRNRRIASLALFGSVLTPNFTTSSDVDMLVRFEENYTPTLLDLADMQFELTDMIGREVDLRTPNELSRYFRDDVIAKAQVIYGS